MIAIKYLSLFSFVSFLILDYLIKNNYLGNSIKTFYFKFIDLNYFYIVLILTSIVFFILMLFSYFGVSLICFDNFLFDENLFKFMTDSGVNSNNVKADGTVNINNPNLNVSIPASSLNNLAAAASVAGGGTLALKVAQQVPGGPGVKVAVGGVTWLASQVLTVVVGKILNSNILSNNNTNNFINWFDGLSNNLNIINNYNDKYNDFPLNLLPYINQLSIVELIFLLIILNIFIVKLKERYPKLAIIIKLKHKITNISLIYSYVFIFISVICLILINVYNLLI